MVASSRAFVLRHTHLRPVPGLEYESRLVERALPWLQRARDRDIAVLVGDPGWRHLPTGALLELGCYAVRTTTDLEDLDRKEGRVYALRA